jgi:hypothetical protein
MPDASNNLCPYCNERECGSDDHIFAEAIGGRRTIRACKPCNDLFGYSFEGSAVATFLHPLLMQLRMAGVPVIDTGARWKRAHVGEDGMAYNVVFDRDGYRLESKSVLVKRDEDNPKILHPIIGDDRPGRKHLKQFLDSNKFRLLSLERKRVEEPLEYKLDWGFNPDLKLTALKMALAAGAIAFPNEVPRFIDARSDLMRADLTAHPASVVGDLRDHPTLDALRFDLCHLIYVEQAASRIHAFVQFFGAVQFWVALATSAPGVNDKALLAVLDPVTGAETFGDVTPLQIPPFRDQLVDAMLPIRKLNAGAAKRGAKIAEMIKVNEIRVDGVPLKPFRPYCATSWTGDVLKKTSESR